MFAPSIFVEYVRIIMFSYDVHVFFDVVFRCSTYLALNVLGWTGTSRGPDGSQDPAASRAARLLGALPSGAATGAAGGEVPQAERRNSFQIHLIYIYIYIVYIYIYIVYIYNIYLLYIYIYILYIYIDTIYVLLLFLYRLIYDIFIYTMRASGGVISAGWSEHILWGQ